MGSAFVFDPDGNYGKIQEVRDAGVMPEGVRYLASVTGPWKLFAVIEFDGLQELTGQVDGLVAGGGFGDPPTATVKGLDRVRRSEYKQHTALVRVEVRTPDPEDLRADVVAAIDSEEMDVVVGDFDILACVVDDDEDNLGSKILELRRVEGVKRTVSLRVIDYVSKSANAPDDGHRIPGG